jgi:hypothetical protein
MQEIFHVTKPCFLGDAVYANQAPCADRGCYQREGSAVSANTLRSWMHGGALPQLRLVGHRRQRTGSVASLVAASSFAPQNANSMQCIEHHVLPFVESWTDGAARTVLSYFG